jgi:hypothetical protein
MVGRWHNKFAEEPLHSVRDFEVHVTVNRYQNTECCTTMTLWQTYDADRSETYIGHHVKFPMQD